MKEVYSQLKSYMEDHKEEMHALWKRIVNIDSGSRNIEGVNKVCAILQEEMEKAGIRTRIIPMKNAGNILIGEWNFDCSDKKPLVFIGHMDTVFPDGSVESNPFRVDEDGNVHGPGCLDMKGGDVVGLYAVKALASIGFKERPVKFIYVGDEENLHMFSNAREVIQSEVQGALAAFNFETGYPDDRLVVGRKGGGIIEVTVHGIASHSGIAPEVGRSAIIEAAHKMIEIESQTDIPKGRLINCGLINGGIGENTIPDTCTFRMGIRFPSVKIRDEILEIIRKAVEHSTVPDTTAEMKTIMLMDSMETTDGVMKLFEHIRRIGEDCGYGTLGSFTVGGVSDSGPAVSAGIPTVCAMGVRGEFNHTPKEYAKLETMHQRAYLTACAAYELPDDLFA